MKQPELKCYLIHQKTGVAVASIRDKEGSCVRGARFEEVSKMFASATVVIYLHLH